MRRTALHLVHAATALLPPLLPPPRTHVGSHAAWRLMSAACAPRCWRQCETLPQPAAAAAAAVAAAAHAARRCRGFASLPHLDDAPLDATLNNHIRDFAIIAHGAALRRPTRATCCGRRRHRARDSFAVRADCRTRPLSPRS
jgi:hypothetical protein